LEGAGAQKIKTSLQKADASGCPIGFAREASDYSHQPAPTSASRPFDPLRERADRSRSQKATRSSRPFDPLRAGSGQSRPPVATSSDRHLDMLRKGGKTMKPGQEGGVLDDATFDALANDLKEMLQSFGTVPTPLSLPSPPNEARIRSQASFCSELL
jgi:hypothetical protein